MASLGHVALGMATGRTYASGRNWRAMAFFGALSLAPDLDVIAFALRIPYDAPWGHRGATHSLVFALGVAVAGAAIARLLHFPIVRTFVAVLLVVASHGLLDALTDGGLGPALLWPFSDERYFAPFNPIPVAPIGLGFLTLRGLSVALTELVLFSPFLFYALVPRRQTAETSR